MSTEFGKGKVLFKSKGFDKANAKHKALEKVKMFDPNQYSDKRMKTWSKVRAQKLKQLDK